MMGILDSNTSHVLGGPEFGFKAEVPNWVTWLYSVSGWLLPNSEAEDLNVDTEDCRAEAPCFSTEGLVTVCIQEPLL